MKSYYHISLAIVAVCLSVCSCANDKDKENAVLTDKTFEEEIPLTLSDSISIDQTFRLFEMTVSNHLLTVVDGAAEDTTLTVYTYPEGTLVQRRFSVGQGPDQFIVVNTGEAKDKDNVLIYDMMKHKCFLINTKQNPAKTVAEFAMPVDDDDMGIPYTYINQYNDSIFLMKFDDPEASARHLVDLKNNKVLWKENVPYRDDKFNYTAYDYTIQLSDSTAVVAYKFLDLVEIYNVSASNGMQLKAQYGEVEDLSLKDEKDIVKKYQDVAHNDKAFYCLRANVEYGLGTEIESYDIATFRPLKKYTLDRPVSNITLNGNKLIGYYPDEQSSVFYTWKLK